MKAFEDCLPKSTGLAHLDASRCRETGDPEFPLAYIRDDGSEWMLHKSRIIRVEEVGEIREKVV